jgi:methylated-DNA-protein-cysteine methyltransferase related protein
VYCEFFTALLPNFAFPCIQHHYANFDSNPIPCGLICASSLDLMLRCNAAILKQRARKKEQGKRDMSWTPVYTFVKRIPRGRVITYGGLAKALRLRGGARAAGHAMAAIPSGKGIPWHRVVGYGGKLLIREPYASLQRKLLESEGVILRESRVDMKKHAWTPAKSRRKTARRTKSTK